MTPFYTLPLVDIDIGNDLSSCVSDSKELRLGYTSKQQAKRDTIWSVILVAYIVGEILSFVLHYHNP